LKAASLFNQLVGAHRVPTISPFRYYAISGAIVSDGIDLIEQNRGALRRRIV
jgi:hypothetical protein